MKQSAFLKKFIDDTYVGAVTQTSKFGVKNVCSKIDFSKDLTIVEYGPGDGVFTKYLLGRMTPDSTLIAIEANGDFVNELRLIPDPRLKIVHGRAEQVQDILGALGKPHADYVISGIPCTFFRPPQRAALVESTHASLKKGGKFLVYQYSPLMTPYLAKEFNEVTLGFVPINMPPMFVMEAKKA